MKPLHCAQHTFIISRKVCLMEKENGKAVSFSLQHFLPEICLRHTKRKFIVHSIFGSEWKKWFSLAPFEPTAMASKKKEIYKLVLETVRVFFSN